MVLYYLIMGKLRHVVPSFEVLVNIMAVGSGVFLFLLLLINGPGVSPDSVDYIATARNLIAGNGFTTYDASPFVSFMPLYPTLLALLMFLGLSVSQSASLIAALSYGGMVYVSGRIFNSCIRNVPLKFFMFAVLIWGISIPRIAVNVWTEMPFLFFTVCFLWMSIRYMGKTTTSLRYVAVTAGFGLLTRSVGLFFIPSIVMVYFLRWKRAWRKNIFSLFESLIITCFVPVLWVLGNFIRADTLLGERGVSTYSIQEVGNTIFYVMGSWFIPTVLPDLLLTLVGAGIVVVCVIISTLTFFPHKTRINFPPFVVISAFTAILFLAVMSYSSSTVALDLLGDRHVSPIYPLVVFLFAGLIDSMSLHRLWFFSRRFIRGVIVLGCIIWLIYPIRNAIRIYQSLVRDSYAYNAHIWYDSELIDYAHTLDDSPDTFIVSNMPDAIFFHTGLTVHLVPRKTYYNSPSVPDNEFAAIDTALESGQKVLLIWFEDKNSRDYVYTPEELPNKYKVKTTFNGLEGFAAELKTR